MGFAGAAKSRPLMPWWCFLVGNYPVFHITSVEGSETQGAHCDVYRLAVDFNRPALRVKHA